MVSIRRVRARPKPRRQSRYVIMLPAILAELCRVVTDNSAAGCSNSEGGNSELRGHLVEVGEQPAGKVAHLLGLTHLDVVEGIEYNGVPLTMDPSAPLWRQSCWPGG